MTEQKTTQGLTAAKAGKASAERRAEQATKLATLRAHLEGLADTDAVRAAKIDACIALYRPILQACHMSKGVNRRVNTLALSAAITGLRGLLRELGATKDASDTSDSNGMGPAPDASAPLEERQAWSRRYVAAVLEADRKDGTP